VYVSMTICTLSVTIYGFVFQPKRQLVTNTPNMPRKAPSRWSPIQKQRPADIDQAFVCTKIIKTRRY